MQLTDKVAIITGGGAVSVEPLPLHTQPKVRASSSRRGAVHNLMQSLQR